MTMQPRTMAAGLRAAAARGQVRLPVRGTSMGDLVPDGAALSIAAGGSPRWGEVWAFCLPGERLVVHRSRGGRDGAWRFQGDRRATADPIVPTEQLVGRVVAVHHADGTTVRLGRFDRWMRGPATAARLALKYRR